MSKIVHLDVAAAGDAGRRGDERSKDERDVGVSGQNAVASCVIVPRSTSKVLGSAAELFFWEQISRTRAIRYSFLQ